MDQTDDQAPQHHHDQESFKDTPQTINETEDDFLLQGQPVERSRSGSRLGDMRIRIELPQHPTFRRVKQGVLEATKETYEPHTPLARAVSLSASLCHLPSHKLGWCFTGGVCVGNTKAGSAVWSLTALAL